MAKFTKLNIGDSVASGGGRVWKKLSAESAEVQDELQGTWVLNETLNYYTPPINFNVSGNFNTVNSSGDIISKELKVISLYKYSSSYFACTIGTVAQGVNVAGQDRFVFYDAKTSIAGVNYSKGKIDGYSSEYGSFYSNVVASSEKGISLRTFTITSKLAEVVDGDILLGWLKANATKTA